MKQKPATPTKKVLWRMTEAAPRGEFVDVDSVNPLATPPGASVPTVPPKRDAPEVSYGSWLESSFELLSGTEVNDGPDTVPDDLFDELFAPEPTVAKLDAEQQPGPRPPAEWPSNK